MTRTLKVVMVVALAATAAAGIYLYRRVHERIPLPPVQPIDVFASLFNTTPTRIMTTANWEKIPVTVPRWQFLSDHTLWLRMHFEDWDRLPDELRGQGLERLLDRYGHLGTDRPAWQAMTAYDWDEVPQPIRAVATVGMIEYWVDRYRVGETYDLNPRDVMRTVKAIAMSESWFDHRALYVNKDGSTDIGIGHEADGDLRLAIRAYNWGIGRAMAGEGEAYLETVERRRRRYFEGPRRSPTWRVLSQFRRERLRSTAAERRLAVR